MVKKDTSRRMNPGDLQRRKEKAKLLVKNKQERQRCRIMAKIRVDPDGLKEEYNRLERKIAGRKFDTNDKRRWAELKDFGPFIDKCLEEREKEKLVSADARGRNRESEIASIAAHVREQKRAAATGSVLPQHSGRENESEEDSYSYYSEVSEEPSDPSTPSDPPPDEYPGPTPPDMTCIPPSMAVPPGYMVPMPMLPPNMPPGVPHGIPMIPPGVPEGPYSYSPPHMGMMMGMYPHMYPHIHPPDVPYIMNQPVEAPPIKMGVPEEKAPVEPANPPNMFIPLSAKMQRAKQSAKEVRVWDIGSTQSETVKEQIDSLYKMPTIDMNTLETGITDNMKSEENTHGKCGDDAEDKMPSLKLNKLRRS